MEISATFEQLRPYRTVIEAARCYRWLFKLLWPLGTVLLTHPLRLRAMVQGRTKSDRLDAQLLAQLLRINQIPLAYIPTNDQQKLRDISRQRARLGEVSDDTESLFLPMVGLAVGNVDCHAVAEAILIRHGKWNPDREPPEIQ